MGESRKEIVLPSGGKCRVRRISGNDFIAAGLTPIVADLRKQSRSKASLEGEFDQRTLENMVKVTEAMLLRCVGKITLADGRTVKIVRKDLDDLTDGEITIEELDQPDADAIVAEIHQLSGLTKGAAQAVAPFPEKPPVVTGPPSDGEGLRPAAV